MSRRYGVVVGTVDDANDPQGEGRVKVSFPFMGGDPKGFWAPVATLMSGGERGCWFMPEVGDEVLVSFEQGDVNHPYVLGFLHNGEQRPPETDPQVRLIRSVNGHEIELRDAGGNAGGIRLEDARSNRIRLDSGTPGGIQIEDALGNRIQLSNGRISITGVGLIEIRAPAVMINGRPVAPSPQPI